MKSLSFFERADEGLVESRALQNRVDTKFVLRVDELDGLLSQLSSEFSVVASGSSMMGRYQNLYFDTDGYRFLREHHRGRRPRFKVRIRHYLDRELSSLEIKEKSSAERTIKLRKPIPFMAEQLSATHREFLDAHPRIISSTLHPSLRIEFSRITLVAKHVDERLTIDTGLGFSHGDGAAVLDAAVIAEIKQSRFSPRSPGMLALRQCGAMSLSISKYMTGGQLLLPSIRLQRYAPRLKRLRRRIA
jgi:hypothetical protein